METISAVPSVTVTEQLTVQPLADLAGAQKLRANVWTLPRATGPGAGTCTANREELYLVSRGASGWRPAGRSPSWVRVRRSSSPPVYLTSCGTAASRRSPTSPSLPRPCGAIPLRPDPVRRAAE